MRRHRAGSAWAANSRAGPEGGALRQELGAPCCFRPPPGGSSRCLSSGREPGVAGAEDPRRVPVDRRRRVTSYGRLPLEARRGRARQPGDQQPSAGPFDGGQGLSTPPARRPRHQDRTDPRDNGSPDALRSGIRGGHRDRRGGRHGRAPTAANDVGPIEELPGRGRGKGTSRRPGAPIDHRGTRRATHRERARAEAATSSEATRAPRACLPVRYPEGKRCGRSSRPCVPRAATCHRGRWIPLSFGPRRLAARSGPKERSHFAGLACDPRNLA